VIGSQKGNTTIELIIYICLIVIAVPVVFLILLNGIKSFETNSRFTKQQDKINSIIMHLDRYINSSSKVEMEDSDINEIKLTFKEGSERYLRFEDGSLLISDDKIVYEKLQDGIDCDLDRTVSVSGFYVSGSVLSVNLKLINTNRLNSNRNINKMYIYKYDIRYK
jgi:cell division protein FtsL